MIKQPIKVIELFAGIGAQVAALRRLGIPYETVGISEIDRFAIQSYNAINGPTYNYGDITKIPMLDYADLWTYSFPCQDLSVAGNQKGISEGTRSGLLLHVERLLELSVLLGNQPKYLLLENVKNLVGKKFKPDFDKWLAKLELLGYNNYWQVLNARDYGVPQNRERVFVVSIRKDVDTKGYKFPEKIPLTRRLKDVLEPQVDERYYLSDKQIKSFMKETIKSIEKGNGFCFKPISENDISRALTLKCGGGRKTDTFIQEPIIIGGMQKHQSIKTDGISTCLTSSMGCGGGYVPMIKEPLACASRGRNPDNPSDRTPGIPTEQRLEINYTGCSNTLTTVEKDNYVLQPRIIQEPINIYPNTGNPQAGRVYNTQGISPALDTCMGGNRMPKISENLSNYRIRKLTPLECWRLMDFTDEEFYAAQFSGMSNSQLYKQAGNSIVVAVIAAIFKELLA